MFRLSPTDPRPIYVQIMDEIRRGIATGVWQPDQPLPSIRQLAQDIRVHPNTVQQAYRELERDGVVYVQRGAGTFVSAKRGAEEPKERRRLADAVADRALRDGYRHGLTLEEVRDAIDRVGGAGKRGAQEPVHGR
jgi:GntR family transcriptional regulator